ncbi:MAG: dihydroorotate dehydrogenase electron transfer subunit [Candidatus Bilamarchaeaceae archaeon]
MISHPMITSKIVDIIKENNNVTTYEIDHRLNASPGQFIMVWLPSIGERPMGIAGEDPLTITVAHVGSFTNEMRKLRKGDPLSFRGPFGNGFTIPKAGERALIVGGGTGIAPLYFLAKKARESGALPSIVFGARSASLFIYKKKLERMAKELVLTTDDGTGGLKGTVMVGIEEAERHGRIDRVYTCGPERMMVAVVKWAYDKGIPCEASLERYMKCGIGVCGSCTIGKHRVCADGPVFPGELLLKIPEFGSVKRDGSGRLTPL